MANIDITDQGGGSLSNGILQLQNGVALDTTLRYVSDQSNTISQLLLATNGTRVNGSLAIGAVTSPSGLLHVDGGASVPRIILDADTNVARIFSFRTNDTQRWAFRIDDNETGTNAGSNFAIRRYNDAGTFIDAPLSINRANGRVSVNERLLVESDSTVATQTSSVIQSSTTNASLVISPNGTGALIASIPDGTATGGNARGNNAVDLQMFRTNSNQVARGANDVIAGGGENRNGTGAYQTIGGGSQNFANGVYTTISGGLANNAGNNYVFIGGGNANNGSGGQYTTIPGGRSNTAFSDYSTVSGGQSNTASTGTHATVVGGINNTATGQYSTVLGGSGNTASGSLSLVGGNSNVASNNGSVAFGFSSTSSGLYSFAQGESVTSSGSRSFSFGQFSTASGTFGLAFGFYPTAGAAHSYAFGNSTRGYLLGQFAISGNTFVTGTNGMQQSSVIANREAILTTGSTTVLSLDGTGTTNLIIPFGNNRSWNVKINYVAVVTAITGTATGVTVGDTKSQNIEIGFKRVGGTSSLVGSGSYSIAQENASMNTSTLVPTAGASQELALTFTAPTFAGGGSVTCRVVAKVELVEVAW